MERSCYRCDNPAIGRGDHVPPLSLFSVGTFEKAEPILVHSCHEHNQHQSKADEYLKFVLSASAEVVPKDVRAGSARSVIRLATMNASLHRFGAERKGDEIIWGSSAPVDQKLLDEALDKVARGVYFHHHRGKKKLTGDLDVHPLFLGLDDSAPPEVRDRFNFLYRQTVDDLSRLGRHATHCDVFAYQIVEGIGLISVNLVFYGSEFATVMKSTVVA